MEAILTYAIELIAAAVAAVVAVKISVARMDERIERIRAEIADLESEHNKIEVKLDRCLDSLLQMNIQLTRLATIIETNRPQNGNQ